MHDPEAPAAARIAAAGKHSQSRGGQGAACRRHGHTEIVYRSAEEIRKALIERGVPPAWLDLTVDEEDEQTTPITREQIRDRAKIEFDKAGKNF
jgi:hypothetical protein